MAGQIYPSSMSDEQMSKFPEKRWSLLVGVNCAPESDKPLLEHAENDVRQMALVLQDHCGFKPFEEPLVGATATSGNVMKAIRRFIHERKDDDFLLFYFSGHGIACRLDERGDDDDIYLVTADFSSLDIDVNPAMHLSLKLLRKMLYDQCYAGKVLIILDCCYAGNISGHGPDFDREDLIKRLARYFDMNTRTASNTKGLRLALTATIYNRAAYVVDGHGPLARWLLPALSGECNDAIDAKGRITFNTLRDYLQDQMSEYPPAGSGGDAGRNCILAYHSRHPNSHFPYGHDPLFRPRKGEFEHLEAILRARDGTPVRLGLIGMGGVGKSKLAREVVLRNRDHFHDGIFWATATIEGQAGTTPLAQANPLIHPLAELANQTNYLPPGDDPARPNEELRARHLCHFLAHHPSALLILDNLDDPNLVATALPELAGTELQCSVIYTSRKVFAPSNVKTYQVMPLDKLQDALHILLAGIRPEVLTLEGTGQQNEQVQAAHSICKRASGLPIALILLRKQLELNEWLTLTELDQELRERGVLAVATDEITNKTSLTQIFQLSWQRVTNELARRLFQLAAYFPEAVPIPLWLLALACDIPEEYSLASQLMKTRLILRSFSLIEDVSKSEIQMHPLLREFGQELVKENAQGRELLQGACERVARAFEDVQLLEQRVKAVGYWNCLAQIRVAHMYITASQAGIEERLKRVERRLDRETVLLATSGLWPDKIPGLFYQQMYNRLLEEELQLPPPPSDGTWWLRQLERVGVEDERLLRVFSGHSGGVNSVAFSPDDTKVLTGSEDATARIFDTASGRTLLILKGHTDVIDSVAYSPDGTCVLTGSRDCTVRLWNTEDGECIRIFEGHTDWINGVAFAPDATLILTGSQDGNAHLWKKDIGVLQATFPLEKEQFPDLPIQTRLWSKNAIKERFATIGYPILHAITCVAFSPDNTCVALGFINGSFTLWNITNNTFRNKRLSSFSATSSIAFSPDSTKLLIGFEDGRICFCSKDQETSIEEYIVHRSKVTSIAFSHDVDGTYILTGSWDGNVILWKVDNDGLLTMSAFGEQAGTINSVAFSHDDSLILLGSSDATARTWMSYIIPSLEKDKALVYKPDDNFYIRPKTPSVIRATFSPEGSQLLVAYHASEAPGKVSLWDIQDKRKLYTFPIDVRWLESGMYFNGKKIVLGHLKGSVQVRDNRAVASFAALDDYVGLIRCVAISLDSSYILAGFDDTTARIWGVTTRRTIKILKGHVRSIVSVAFSSDGTQLLTGSQDNTARIWKRHGKQYTPIVLRGHEATVTCVAFSPDGKNAFTGYADGMLGIWNSENGTLQVLLDGQANSTNLIIGASEGGLILTGHQFNQVRLWGRDELGMYQLQGAYATHRALKAAHWQNDHEVILVDDNLTEDFPRIYKLRLED